MKVKIYLILWVRNHLYKRKEKGIFLKRVIKDSWKSTWLIKAEKEAEFPVEIKTGDKLDIPPFKDFNALIVQEVRVSENVVKVFVEQDMDLNKFKRVDMEGYEFKEEKLLAKKMVELGWHLKANRFSRKEKEGY